MSIIDEILVLLDGQKPLTLNEVEKKMPHRTLQIVSATLGRLEAKGWVKITKQKGGNLYEITLSGAEQVTGNLAEIKQRQLEKWDGEWQIVAFNIPEKERFKRDLFRQHLDRLGYGRVENSLWIAPRDNAQKLDKIINKLTIQNKTTYFSTGKTKPEVNRLLAKKFQWDWKELNNQYGTFISKSKKFLETKKDIYSARLLVYEYAKILSRDPKFPSEITPRDYLGFKADGIYQKIRQYCY